MDRHHDEKHLKRKWPALLLAVLLVLCCMGMAACSDGAEAGAGAEDETAVESQETETNEDADADADKEDPSVQEDDADAPEESSEEAAAGSSDGDDSIASGEEPAQTKKDKAKESKKSKPKAKKKDSGKDKGGKSSKKKEKEKKWVEPVYKTVEHPEEGHYETVTKWYCLCGKYVGSKEGWRKHREDFIESNGGVCNGEHVRPDPREEKVWVVDKKAWTEKVLVTEGHWE